MLIFRRKNGGFKAEVEFCWELQGSSWSLLDGVCKSLWTLLHPVCVKLFIVHERLKAYSLISYRGCSQKFQNWIFVHLFVAFLPEVYFLKGIWQKSFPYEIQAIFSSILVYENLFNTVVYGASQIHIIMHNMKTKKQN